MTLGTSRDRVRTDPRRAGAVQRYHTWPTIQRQTVAEASWNVARILVMIWPEAPVQAITHALLNDCGEVVTGDLPFPVKRDNPALKSEISMLEVRAITGMGIAHLEAAPADDVWRRRVKICDMIEMWEFGLDEVMLGSQFAVPIVEGTADSVAELMGQFGLSSEDQSLILEYMTWRRRKMLVRA